jgi:hypothetical protein
LFGNESNLPTEPSSTTAVNQLTSTATAINNSIDNLGFSLSCSPTSEICKKLLSSSFSKESSPHVLPKKSIPISFSSSHTSLKTSPKKIIPISSEIVPSELLDHSSKNVEEVTIIYFILFFNYKNIYFLDFLT